LTEFYFQFIFKELDSIT